MENMRPENSFPQICVVSVDKFVGSSRTRVVKTAHFAGYGRSMDLSNPFYLHKNN